MPGVTLWTVKAAATDGKLTTYAACNLLKPGADTVTAHITNWAYVLVPQLTCFMTIIRSGFGTLSP